jgi:hypothetical protein
LLLPFVKVVLLECAQEVIYFRVEVCLLGWLQQRASNGRLGFGLALVDVAADIGIEWCLGWLLVERVFSRAHMIIAQ